MPPPFLLYIPAFAKAYARAIEPSAVINHDTIDKDPTCANLVGSMIIPDPIMFTAVKIVSCNTLILFSLVLLIGTSLRKAS